MNSHHIMPVEGETILGMCIDADNAKAHEDMIRVTKSGDGNMIQVDIAVVVPPVKNVPLGDLQKSLDNLITSLERQPIYFMDPKSRRRYGFSSDYPRSAIVVTYVINTAGELLLEELVLSQAIGTMISFSDYHKTEKSEEIISVLRKILSTKPGIESHVNEELSRTFPKSEDSGYKTTLMLTQLFNSTCRLASREKSVRIPFIRRPLVKHGDNFFLINDGLAKFSACLRDPCAFINASNLVSYLSGEKILPFSKKYLQEMLPIRATYDKGGLIQIV